MTGPNGVNTDYAYDNLSRLLSLLHKLSGNTIDGASYTVDAVGNRTAKTNHLPSAPTENYTYDAIYQLAQVAQAGPTTTESYTYDAVGNRLASLGVSPWSYNSSNHLTQIAGSPATTFAYDNNGNTTSKTDPAGTTSYTWDYENRLTSVTLPNSGGTVSFTYDPLGRRIRKVFGSATTIYAYDGENIVEETDANGTAVARYAMGLSIDEPLAILRSSATHFYQVDGLGSVTSLSNSAGSLASTYTYDSFGNLSGSTGSVVNPFRYTAREWDAETGLYFYRARYYNQPTGRFLSEDPLAFAVSPDFYPYVFNSPTNLRDPSGNTPAAPLVAACAANLPVCGAVLAITTVAVVVVVNSPPYQDAAQQTGRSVRRLWDRSKPRAFPCLERSLLTAPYRFAKERQTAGKDTNWNWPSAVGGFPLAGDLRVSAIILDAEIGHSSGSALVRMGIPKDLARWIQGNGGKRGGETMDLNALDDRISRLLSQARQNIREAERILLDAKKAAEAGSDSTQLEHVLQQLTHLYVTSGEIASADRAYEERENQFPKPSNKLDRAFFYFQSACDPKKALAKLAEITTDRVCRTDFSAYYSALQLTGRVHLKMGHRQKAVAILQKLIRLLEKNRRRPLFGHESTLAKEMLGNRLAPKLCRRYLSLARDRD